MKKLLKRILVLSLVFTMIGSVTTLSANPKEENVEQVASEENDIEIKIQRAMKKRKRVSSCIKENDFNQKGLDLLLKDSLILKAETGEYKYNKRGENKKEDFEIVYSSIEKVDDTTYYAISTFDKYTMKTQFHVPSIKKCDIVPGCSMLTRPDTPEEIAEKLAKKLVEDKHSAISALDQYRINAASVIDLNEYFIIVESQINAAETSEQVKDIYETSIAVMKEKVQTKNEENNMIIYLAKKNISNEEAIDFINNFALELSLFAKNPENHLNELSSMFLNESVEVSVSSLITKGKVETVVSYLDNLSRLAKTIYNNNVILNISLESDSVELFGDNAVVKVLQTFNGNEIYKDVTIKSISLAKQNEKIYISKIDVLETKPIK